jgi:hypothetical protein
MREQERSIGDEELVDQEFGEDEKEFEEAISEAQTSARPLHGMPVW